MKKVLLVLLIFSCYFVPDSIAENGIPRSVLLQEKVVSGTVTSRIDGSPLMGVSVRVKNLPSRGSVSGRDGTFSLSVPKSATMLVFTFVGFNQAELEISKENILNAALDANQTNLNDVVITAGGIEVSRRELGAQSTTITGEQLTQSKAFNIGSALSGKVAGLQVNTVSSGVNPNVRLVLRGNRSILGDNEALIVVDNVVVPSSVLGNLNPEDIEDVEVLNGGGAAALFGSGAANGAIMITTKRAKGGESRITGSQTTSFERVSHFPGLQTRYGAGTSPDDVPTYDAQENQQFGPEFDGSMVEVGLPLADGTVNLVPYSATNERDKFWELGIANQTDFNISSGSKAASYYMSAQHFGKSSITPGDKYNRFSVRVNGDKDLGNNIRFSFSTNYVQNSYNTSGAVASTYNNVLQTPANIPLTSYKDWQNNDFANPNGYYNKYYLNPYFGLENNRRLTDNDYLNGNVEFKWFPVKELSMLFRVSLSTRNQESKSYINKFDYDEFSLSRNSNLNNIRGSVADGTYASSQLNPEVQLNYIKNLFKDFKLNLIVGASLRTNDSKSIDINSLGGLIAADLFNVKNSIEKPEASESIIQNRQMGVFFNSRFSYKDYLYVNLTGRNDWRSVLAPEHRSFFYPSASVSFIPSEIIPSLRNSESIESIKLRLSVSQVGTVQIGSYSLVPTFAQGMGYPYNSVPGYAIGSRIVARDIEPEMTNSIETGFDVDFFKGRATGSATYYKTHTKNQTMAIGVSATTGYTSFLTNIGEVENSGIETAVKIEPLRMSNGLSLVIGANYTYNENNVVSLSNDLGRINLALSDYGGVYALPGKAFPMLRGADYFRDPQGRIIVSPITGYPTVNTGTYVELGNTEPRHRLGLDALLSFKGIRFSTLFEYRGGNVMYSEVGSGFDFSGAGARTTYFNRERFVIPNSSYLDPVTNEYVENTDVTVRNGAHGFWSSSTYNRGAATNYVFSGAFWKLREAALSYKLPQSWLRRTGFVKGVGVGIQGRNLFIWKPKTNLYTDPEYSAGVTANVNAIGITTLSQTPPIRFYGINLSVNL